MNNTNPQTGLTPQQERVVNMIVSGIPISDISAQLKIDRSTIYQWSKKLNFKTYYNKLRQEIQENLENKLWNLHQNAIDVISGCLNGSNENLRFKSAVWIIEKIQGSETGNGDLIEVIRNKMKLEAIGMSDKDAMKKRYMELLRENGLV